MFLRIAKHLLLVGGLVLCSVTSFAKSWPTVRPVSKTLEVADSRHMFFTSVVQDKGGKGIFKLVCFPGGHTEHDFDYSGLVQCRLIDLGPNAESADVLTQPNAGRDWLSRGKFEVSELTGNCSNDPDFGSKRVFLLRGMRIALQVSSLKETQTASGESGRDAHASYLLSFDVTNDKTARAANDRRVPWPTDVGFEADCSKKEKWWDK
jgi:hypothetical protein